MAQKRTHYYYLTERGNLRTTKQEMAQKRTHYYYLTERGNLRTTKQEMAKKRTSLSIFDRT